MKYRFLLAPLILLSGAPICAQDNSLGEVIVTASRIEQDDYERDMPIIGLRRTADFLVYEATIMGDTRDPKQRASEIRQMLKKTVEMAKQYGVSLAYGDYNITPLTTNNLDDISLKNGDRPDSQLISFLVTYPISPATSIEEAERKVETFVEAVPEVGRAQLDIDSDYTMSIVNPDQYRKDIATEVMKDAKSLAQQMGADYGVTIEGLNMPVLWQRSGPTSVMLYIPYKLVIVPKP